MIAALYVDKKGCYIGLPNVDPWDITRDARLYKGPYPVVAHPPCNLWTNLACVNYKRWGGEHNRPGNDGRCFELALKAVRTYGGVLEHPAFSHAWSAYNLCRPEPNKWIKDGEDWVCEIWQSAYGHKARKRTWLLYNGKRKPFDLCWDRPAGTHQISRDFRGKEGNKPRLVKRKASATPILLRGELIRLAEWSMNEDSD